MQVSLFLMSTGKLFHRVAAAFVKVLSPYVTVRVRGTVNRIVDGPKHFICLVWKLISASLIVVHQGALVLITSVPASLYPNSFLTPANEISHEECGQPPPCDKM